MYSTPFIYIFFAIQLFAEVAANPTPSLETFSNHTTSSFIDEELPKISACLWHDDWEEITGNLLKYELAGTLSIRSLKGAHEVIGLTELRSVLGFAPSVPWTHRKNWTEDEIAVASTIEEYYEMKEPDGDEYGLDNKYVHEKNLPPAIKFLDKRFPTIRIIYREYLQEKFDSLQRSIDREGVDFMIGEYILIRERVGKAVDNVRHLTIDCVMKQIKAELYNQRLKL
ncbi:hypothetical protein GCK72_008483 [Caenorhabditis remanei]|uniref:Uncharacterized protein n=1 Tax=Caenorhabditis remanei TaxID=31234 RepID=A0A6A5GYT5_CAERE|nr:hypothetical protein GCK72_008483 [Caenorhabditis remanei]KAF1760237.1 hypothetical protein GCK72_008483 [Caenorhabditis remanei]